MEADRLRTQAGLATQEEKRGQEGSGENMGLQFRPYVAMHIRQERHKGEDNARLFLNCSHKFQGKIRELQEETIQSMSTLQAMEGKTISASSNSNASLNFESPQISASSLPPLRDIIVITDNSTLKERLHSWDTSSVKRTSIEIFHVDQGAMGGDDVSDEYKANLHVFAEIAILVDAECLVRSRSGFSEVPQQVSISNEVTMERCGVQVDECSGEAVSGAVQSLYWSGASTGTTGSVARDSVIDSGQGNGKEWSSWVKISVKRKEPSRRDPSSSKVIQLKVTGSLRKPKTIISK